MKYFLIMLMLVMLAGCSSEPKEPSDYFWYPVELKHATCDRYEGDIYKMMNSKGWRSWPYYMDKTDKLEVELNDSCVFKILKKYPEYPYNGMNRGKLTFEQRELLIEGFN